MNETLFTTSALLSLLTQIEELKDLDIGISDNGNGQIQIQIGQSAYNIRPDDTVVDIQVDQSQLSDIQETSEETLTRLDDKGEINLEEYVESGPIVELLKTLLVGGIVRAGVKSLKQ